MLKVWMSGEAIIYLIILKNICFFYLRNRSYLYRHNVAQEGGHANPSGEISSQVPLSEHTVFGH